MKAARRIWLAFWTLATALLLVLNIVAHNVRVMAYGDATTLNAGVVITGYAHCGGWETRGTPGIFFDTDCN